MAKIGRICGVCGNIGQVEKSSLQASAENQPEIWICENCRIMRQTEMAERRKPEKGPAKRFENSKVKFLSSEDVISMGTGTVRPCIKRSTTSRTAPIKTATPNASSSGSKETGNNELDLKGQLPYHLDFVAWKGSLEVHDLFGNIIVDLAAYLPLQVSAKLVGAIETLPAKLQMRMVPHFGALPKLFKDIGVFLLPSDRSCRLKTINLLRQLDSKKHALKMKINASLELVVHSSQLLAENFQRIEGAFFLWGFFCNCKIRSDSKKKKYSSPNVTPGKTCSEFRTPIAQDKRSDVFKSTDQVGEVIVGTSHVCGNNSLEKKAVVDNFDVPPGFTKLPVEQEISPMYRQPETSMPGKEIQSSYKEVAPGCSSFSDKNNKESGRKGWFSLTGLGILEATLEECENQEYSEHAPGSTDKDVCDTSASPGMPQQVESPPAFETSGQILIKHEKELLVPLPIGLEISPGNSRAEVEARKEKNISNQHLETPPGFAPLGGALIKQEQDSSPIQVVHGISPSFSGSIEQRKEKNLSSQCKGSQPSMNQVLNVHTAKPDHFMDRPLLENQGIIHQQLPDGKRTVAFTYPAVQETTSRSCDIQLTSPHAAIAKVSDDNSQCTMPNQHIQSYPEQSNRTSSMHATGEIQRLHSSLTTPDVKYKDVSFSQMVAQSRDEFNQLHVALHNAKEPILTPAPSHFHVLDPSFLQSSSRDRYHSSINKQTAEITAIREEELQRDYVRGSPVWSRERSRSRSPVPRRYSSQSRSPGPRRYSSQSRSPVPRRYSRQSRSPVPRRYSSRSRSPVSRRYSSRSRSPIRRRQRSRTRSPVQRQYRNRSKSPVSRWNRSRPKNTFRGYRGRAYRGNRNWVRNRGHAGNIYDPGQNSSQYKGWCSSRFRGIYASDHSSPSHSRGRDRSSSLSPALPVDTSWN